MDITIPQRIGNGPLRDQLYTMIVSGQSEPKAIAELVCDCLDNCDDEPNNYVAGIAYEFIEWATALLGSVCPQFQNRNRYHDMQRTFSGHFNTVQVPGFEGEYVVRMYPYTD